MRVIWTLIGTAALAACSATSVACRSAPSASATGERGCRKAGYNRLAVTVSETEVHLAGAGVRLGDAPNWHLEARLKRPGGTP